MIGLVYHPYSDLLFESSFLQRVLAPSLTSAIDDCFAKQNSLNWVVPCPAQSVKASKLKLNKMTDDEKGKESLFLEREIA